MYKHLFNMRLQYRDSFNMIAKLTVVQHCYKSKNGFKMKWQCRYRYSLNTNIDIDRSSRRISRSRWDNYKHVAHKPLLAYKTPVDVKECSPFGLYRTYCDCNFVLQWLSQPITDTHLTTFNAKGVISVQM